MEIAINRLRNHAAIRVSPEAMKRDTERLLKHELLHIVFDRIREEHDFQMAALDSDRREEYSKRHLTEIEKAVELLSYVL